jgi:hypothetical protein
MSKKNLLASAVFLAFFPIFFAGTTAAQTNDPRFFDARFVVRSVRTIHLAQTTYQAVLGNGSYGSLKDLRQAAFIDAALASGEKYGYRFTLFVTHPTATTPAKFKLSATPRRYSRSGRFSFFVDETGELRGADKNGGAADETDPVIDDCSLYGDSAGNERCAILALRGIYQSETTYLNTAGNGSFGSLSDLYSAGLLRLSLAGGAFHGYNFAVTVFPAPNPSFKVVATPQNYGVSGRRSFYVGLDGIIRGADRQGGNADENDPPVDADQGFKRT